MSDTDSLSDYPSDLEFVADPLDYDTESPFDSGIESNDGYLTDIREDTDRERERRLTRNNRLFSRLLALRRFRQP